MLDVARKVVGVGSVGTRCWIVFLRGKDEGDPLFLQFKEAQESVLAPYLKSSHLPNQGYRVVSGQRLIQGSPDILLGWGIINKTHFYIRQLRDMKGSYEFDPAVDHSQRHGDLLWLVRLGSGPGPCQIGRCRNDCRVSRQDR